MTTNPESTVPVLATAPQVDVAAAVADAVRPWRQKVRDAENRVDAVREAIVDLFREDSLDDLKTRSGLNEFLSALGLRTLPRVISGEVEIVIRRTVQFEELDVEDDEDTDDAVTRWVVDEGFYDRWDWDTDELNIDISADSDER